MAARLRSDVAHAVLSTARRGRAVARTMELGALRWGVPPAPQLSRRA